MRHLRALMKILAVSALTAGVMAVPAVTPAVAGPLPNGFILQDTPTGLSGSNWLTDFGFLPDESTIVIGKAGGVNWVPKTGAPRSIATIQVNNVGDLGLIGLAIAPDYSTSHYIYTTYTKAGTGTGSFGALRMTRWTVAVDGNGDPVGLGNEVIVLDTYTDEATHAISTVVAAEDGTLWLSIGDSARFDDTDPPALRAQDINDVHGKLLHLKGDGTGVPTNPFYEANNPASNRSKVYATGLRSPFRFSLDPTTGQPIVGDVGYNTTEEVDLVAPGNNYGWPCWEGNDKTPGYRDLAGCANVPTVNPLWTYTHSTDGTAVTGGVVYTGTTYPAEYRGAYFFGDYTGKRLWTMRFNGAGNLLTPPQPGGFATDIGAPVKFMTAPSNGDIVYADIFAKNLRRLVWAPGNAAPVAKAKAKITPETRTVAFDATDSTDPNGDALTYTWDFGDGTTGTGPTVNHAYGAGETFTAKLTAKDPLGLTNTAQIVVAPGNHPPVLNLAEPDDAHEYAAGESIDATATATDQEDGNLQVSWSINLVHCVATGACHLHPSSDQTGPDFHMTFEGHPGKSYIEVTAHATDSKGTETTETFTAKAKQRRITVQSDTPVQVTIGDEQTSSGLFTVGQQLTIQAPQRASDGVAEFEKWGNGSTNRSLPFTVPDGDTTIDVTYLTPIAKKYAADQALRSQVGTPVGEEQGDSASRSQEYTNGYLFWSPETDVTEMHGEFLAAYLAAGGRAKFGVPSSGVLTNAGNTGTRVMLSKGGAIYKSPSTPAAAIQTDNYTLYKALNAEAGELGYPTDNEKLGQDTTGGHYNVFQHGTISTGSAATGTHVLRGDVNARYAALNYANAYLGYPVTDENPTTPAGGRWASFQNGHIWWSPGTGAHNVQGAIGAKWAEKNFEQSYLGYPTTDDAATFPAGGYYNMFQRGTIFFSEATGAHNIQGAIYNKWAEKGYERSFLGYPTTDDTATFPAGGYYNIFQNGAIFYSDAVGGAHNIQGAIYYRWRDLGSERSYLGYPIRDERQVAGGYQSDFQNGYIFYNSATGQLTDKRY